MLSEAIEKIKKRRKGVLNFKGASSVFDGQLAVSSLLILRGCVLDNAFYKAFWHKRGRHKNKILPKFFPSLSN
jgi:hypothetical protein